MTYIYRDTPYFNATYYGCGGGAVEVCHSELGSIGRSRNRVPRTWTRAAITVREIDAVLTNVQLAIMGRVLAARTVCMNVQVIGA